MSILEALLNRAPSVDSAIEGKAATGVGALWGETETPLSQLLGNSPRAKAVKAVGVWRGNIWVRAAERAISTRLASTPWWLEDDDGQKVDADSPEGQQAVRDLFAMPYRPLPDDPVTATPRTWRALSAITSRHMGIIGYSTWYLSGTEALAGTPAEIIYVHPGRMTPATNKQGGLVGWVMDAGGENPVPFDRDEIVLFALEPPDEGFLSTGLVESALAKVEMSRLSDRHANYVLASGGRLAGLYRPTANNTIPDDTFNAMVSDLRSVTEMPDAAKRSLVLKGPIEFQETSAKPGDLKLIDLANMSRDDILGLWGVPKTQLGMDVPAGLNSGDTKGKDEAVLWQSAIGPRLDVIRETSNLLILNRYAELPGVGTLRLVTDDPTFDDAMPAYDMAQKALAQPLTTSERRAIIGLAPFGDKRDDEVWMPFNVVPAHPLWEQEGVFGFRDPVPGAIPPAGKARINPRQLSAMRSALGKFLKEQGERIGRKMEAKQAAVKRKPNDTSPWWNDKVETEELEKALRPFVGDLAVASAKTARGRIRGKAELSDAEAVPFDERILAIALEGIGDRVTLINSSTRDMIKSWVQEALKLGMSPAELGTWLRDIIDPLPSDAVGQALLESVSKNFASELRAETIARTEMRVAQNRGTIAAYDESGIEMVEMQDGDQDEACAARDGKRVPIAEALRQMELEHPNGTLDFIPLPGVNAAGESDTGETVPPEFTGKAEPVSADVLEVTEPESTTPAVPVFVTNMPRITIEPTTDIREDAEPLQPETEE